MNIILHVVDPKELFLVWKPPLDSSSSRENLLVAKIETYENSDRLIYQNGSVDYQKALEQGFNGYPAFDKDQSVHKAVMGTFLRRLPPRNRSDFDSFLEFYRLSTDQDLSDFALLANTGGKLPRDGFSIIPSLLTTSPPCELLIEVAGSRHRECIQQGFLPGEDAIARFDPEPENEYDSKAIKVITGDYHIGYVNRLQNEGLKRWIDEGREIKANIDRINGTKERPVIYLFLEVK